MDKVDLKKALEEQNKKDIQECSDALQEVLKKYSCSLNPICIVTQQGVKMEVQIIKV